MGRLRGPVGTQVDFAEYFDERGNGAGPTRLMAGADAGTVVAMEIFIE